LNIIKERVKIDVGFKFCTKNGVYGAIFSPSKYHFMIFPKTGGLQQLMVPKN
jgi:hypothetical protein